MIPLSVLRSYSPHPDKLDLTGLTQDEITHGIKSSKLPDYIRYKQYLTDTNEALAQLAEMIIQFAVNLSLDPDQTLDWARKLQQALPQSEFDSWVATLLDGGPSIFMNTLSELQTTYPNGAAGVALVRETDPAKIYVWNGSAWEDFGDYQGIEIKENTIGTQHLQDNAITQPKLADTYTQNGQILDGSLSNYTRAGSYEVVYSTTITDLPTGFKQSGHLLNAKASGGWTIQFLSTISNKPQLYYRTLRNNGVSISQVEDWVLINQESFGREKLSDAFMSNGEFLDENDDLNAIHRDGLYVALESVLNKPKDLTGTFFLEVKAYIDAPGGKVRWVVQDIYRFGDYKHLYTRYIDVVNEPNKAWKLINQEDNTDLNNLTQKHKITQDRVTELSSRNPFKYKEFDKAYITIVWDDGRNDLDKVQEVYKDYPSVPISLAIPSNVLLANKALDGTAAAPRIQTVVNEILSDPKNELLGHGKTSGAITANRTAEWVDDELGLAQVDYASLGYDVRGAMLSGATDPQGVYSASNYDDVGYGYIAKRYYDYGDNLAYDEPYNTKRTWTRTLEGMKPIIADAIANKKWISFFAHTMDGSEIPNTEENHRALLDYILGLDGIEFTTYRRMYETFGSTELEQRLEILEG